MKRFLTCILVILFLSLNNSVVYGDEHKQLIIITETDHTADLFVKDSIVSLIVPQEYKFDYSEIQVLRGLYVYGYTPYDLTIYPVVRNGIIIATIQVVKDSSGNYCATYSQEYVDIINESIKRLRSQDAFLLSYENEGIIVTRYDEEVKEKFQQNGHKCEREDFSVLNIEIATMIDQTRDIIYVCNWYTHDINSGGITKCVPYSLHNILYNKGQYTKANTSSEALNTSMGNLSGGYLYPEVKTYCNSHSIYYTSTLYTPDTLTGKLDWGYVYQSIINGDYVMAICTQVFTFLYGTGTGTSEHYIGVIGVSVSNTAASIIVYDPHGSGNGKYTVTYGSGSVVYSMMVGSQTRTNTWNRGYFRDLH